MHVEHTHRPPAGFGGGLIPAAAQLKPCVASASFGLSGRGASHTAHLSPDVLGSMHSEHVHESPVGFGGGFIPAALQSNPLAGLAGGAGAAGTRTDAFVKS